MSDTPNPVIAELTACDGCPQNTLPLRIVRYVLDTFAAGGNMRQCCEIVEELLSDTRFHQ